MNFTYYGHACFAVEVGNKTLLFDPFISGNPLAAAINPQSLKADYILISHGHADHLADAVAIAKRTGATIVASYEVSQWWASKARQRPIPSIMAAVVNLILAGSNSSMPSTPAACPTGLTAATRAGLSCRAARETFTTPATPR